MQETSTQIVYQLTNGALSPSAAAGGGCCSLLDSIRDCRILALAPLIDDPMLGGLPKSCRKGCRKDNYVETTLIQHLIMHSMKRGTSVG